MMERYVVLDVATTGLDANPDRAIEIAVAFVVNGRQVAAFETLINPGMPNTTGAMSVNCITNDMLADAPLPADVWPRIVDMIGVNPVVVHNAEFDSAFVNHELGLLGLPLLDSQWICSMEHGWSLLGYRPRLRDLTEACGVPTGRLRRSKDNVDALVGVTTSWWPSRDGSGTLGDILGDFN